MADLTGNANWVGIVFQVDGKKITPLFVELSGGIDSNSSKEKRKEQRRKIIRQFVMLKVKKAERVDTPY